MFPDNDQDDLMRVLTTAAQEVYGPQARIQVGWDGFPMSGKAFAELVIPGGVVLKEPGTSTFDALKRLAALHFNEK